MMRNAIAERFPTYTTTIDLVREPTRTYHMMKDDDLKRMFE
ncbi:MAG: hypothetical protein WCJ81_03035 [bacterium]